jgi:hypothetical protein
MMTVDVSKGAIIMENQQAFEQAPTAVSVTVPGRRQSAPREYLTEREVERLIKAAEREPLGPPRCDCHPDRLQARPASLGAGRAALG